MIDKLDKKECCGCNVCGDACPKGAITCLLYTSDAADEL